LRARAGACTRLTRHGKVTGGWDRGPRSCGGPDTETRTPYRTLRACKPVVTDNNIFVKGDPRKGVQLRRGASTTTRSAIFTWGHADRSIGLGEASTTVAPAEIHLTNPGGPRCPHRSAVDRNLSEEERTYRPARRKTAGLYRGRRYGSRMSWGSCCGRAIATAEGGARLCRRRERGRRGDLRRPTLVRVREPVDRIARGLTGSSRGGGRTRLGEFSVAAGGARRRCRSAAAE